MSPFNEQMSREKGTNDRDGTRARIRERDIVPSRSLSVLSPECPAVMGRLTTFEQVSAVWSYDAFTGFLHWKVSSPQRWPGKCVSTKRDGCYVVVQWQGFAYKAHRLAWLLHYGQWPQFEVDHINGNRADNRITNLRDVPRQVNAMNQSYHRAGTNRNGVPLHKYSPCTQLVQEGVSC